MLALGAGSAALWLDEITYFRLQREVALQAEVGDLVQPEGRRAGPKCKHRREWREQGRGGEAGPERGPSFPLVQQEEILTVRSRKQIGPDHFLREGSLFSEPFGAARNRTPSDACRVEGVTSPPIRRTGTYRRETSRKNRSRSPFP